MVVGSGTDAGVVVVTNVAEKEVMVGDVPAAIPAKIVWNDVVN